VVAVCIAWWGDWARVALIAAAHDPHGEPLALFEGIAYGRAGAAAFAIIVAVASLFHMSQTLHNVRKG